MASFFFFVITFKSIETHIKPVCRHIFFIAIFQRVNWIHLNYLVVGLNAANIHWPRSWWNAGWKSVGILIMSIFLESDTTHTLTRTHTRIAQEITKHKKKKQRSVLRISWAHCTSSDVDSFRIDFHGIVCDAFIWNASQKWKLISVCFLLKNNVSVQSGVRMPISRFNMKMKKKRQTNEKKKNTK